MHVVDNSRPDKYIEEWWLMGENVIFSQWGHDSEEAVSRTGWLTLMKYRDFQLRRRLRYT